jgi:hypothetical protein
MEPHGIKQAEEQRPLSARAAKTTRCYKNCGIPDDLLDGIFEPQVL